MVCACLFLLSTRGRTFLNIPHFFTFIISVERRNEFQILTLAHIHALLGTCKTYKVVIFEETVYFIFVDVRSLVIKIEQFRSGPVFPASVIADYVFVSVLKSDTSVNKRNKARSHILHSFEQVNSELKRFWWKSSAFVTFYTKAPHCIQFVCVCVIKHSDKDSWYLAAVT